MSAGSAARRILSLALGAQRELALSRLPLLERTSLMAPEKELGGLS